MIHDSEDDAHCSLVLPFVCSLVLPLISPVSGCRTDWAFIARVVMAEIKRVLGTCTTSIVPSVPSMPPLIRPIFQSRLLSPAPFNRLGFLCSGPCQPMQAPVLALLSGSPAAHVIPMNQLTFLNLSLKLSSHAGNPFAPDTSIPMLNSISLVHIFSLIVQVFAESVLASLEVSLA